MDKCREEFEKYCKSKWFINLEVSDEGDYIAPQTRLKFETWCSAWQASRESMRAIKLPKHSNPLKDKTIMFISDVKILLESTGINVEIDE